MRLIMLSSVPCPALLYFSTYLIKGKIFGKKLLNIKCVLWRHAVVHLVEVCTTSRVVAGSIPGVVIGIFHRHKLSRRTMALGSTQPPAEMSTRNIS
jgi:hypothetical protein